MARFAPALPLAVAYSGGADSTALLVACARQWPGQVMAVHVHHGLQAAADEFERHCHRVCAALTVPLVVQAVDARPVNGQSPEDAARRARYKAFEALALTNKAQTAIKTIVIAQHADDQIETVLLALSRGAGLPGLSAMPQAWTRGGIQYQRPLLKVSSADIRKWLAAQGVSFIEDPTNVDERFTRNRIRARVLPALQACFPQFRDTFARSAAHAAQAANVLRHWLQTVYQAAASAAQLDELMRQVSVCRTRGHALHLKVADGFCVRRGKVLHWYNPAVLTPTFSPQCP